MLRCGGQSLTHSETEVGLKAKVDEKEATDSFIERRHADGIMSSDSVPLTNPVSKNWNVIVHVLSARKHWTETQLHTFI
jgi:hypothetical protein